MQKVWSVKKYDKEKINELVMKYNISEMLAKLILAREIEDVDMFLNGTLEDLKDPYKMKDMEKFVERINKAKENNEKICIYGDYDVDGITSITVMYKFLKKLGLNVIYYLPDRLMEGYGVNTGALDKIKNEGVKLVITVDCGITAVEEVNYAKSIGLDMCITDHHECADKLPEAVCIVNPKQKDDETFSMLAGVGVAFKCITALAQKYNMPKDSYLKYLDIVAVGTISDIVPLVDENRIISKYGLEMMKETKNLGLKSLLNIINFKSIDSTMVSFGMAPRINACGRMGHQEEALNLLLSKEENEVKELTQKINEYNKTRQEIEKNIYNEAVEQIEKEGLDTQNTIVVSGKGWHHGVIGIVSSKITELYFKPSILLCEEDGECKGSGRSIPGFDLHEALMECNDTIDKFGGHAMAVGINIKKEKVEEFKEEFEKIAKEKEVDKIIPILNLDAEIKLDDVNKEMVDSLKELEPFGEANKMPIFAFRNLKIDSIRSLSEGKHLRLSVKDNKNIINAIGFNMGVLADTYRIGDRVDIAGNLEINSFNGVDSIQINIKDIMKSI